MENTKMQNNADLPAGAPIAPSPAGDIKCIDFAQAMKIVNNNTKLYLRLLERFSNNDMISPFFECINKKDVVAAEAAAHAIKGVSANLSLTGLTKIFTAIDNLLKTGAMPTEAEITEARQAYDEAISVIKALISNPEMLERLVK